jgi:hypothetical protein
VNGPQRRWFLAIGFKVAAELPQFADTTGKTQAHTQ